MKIIKAFFLMAAALLVVPCARVQVASDHMRGSDQKKAVSVSKRLNVGMAGFEPTTSSTPCWRDTGLRYIPKYSILRSQIYIKN
jgi:hypothetical protein